MHEQYQKVKHDVYASQKTLGITRLVNYWVQFYHNIITK